MPEYCFIITLLAGEHENKAVEKLYVTKAKLYATQILS